MSIKSFLKRILPASYKKIDSSKKELLDIIKKLNNDILLIQNEIKELKQTVENETNWKRADIVNDIKPILSELKQTVENESNWKRADIVNDLRPILSELKQTVENESNWKRHDIQKAMEESQYRIKNIEKMISINFYENLKKADESKIDFERRMLTYLPKSICKFMYERNMYMEEVVHVLLWNQAEIPFEDLDYTWTYLLENSNSSKWELLEHYTRFLFQHGDLLNNLENVYKYFLPDFEKWTSICQLSYVSFLFYKDNEEKAVEILKNYIAQHGEENIDHFIPVAFLAKKHFGISSDSVMLSAKRFETMRNNDGLFEKLVASGSFAIVGNGPQENGKSSGEKIDTHDLVLRFNAYDLSKQFEMDYGKKSDIWANCLNIHEDKHEKGNFKYFMYLPGIYDEPIDDRFLDDFENAFTVDMLAIRKEIYEKTGLYCTSNGFNLIFAAIKLNKNFSADDCFGFSFKEEVINSKWLHYDNQEVTSSHSLEQEKKAIFSLFSTEGEEPK